MLKEKMSNFIEENKMDIVIVTDSFYYATDGKNEEYASDFYDYNDFGMQFENYSGVLLLRNAYEQDPYFDMYSFGNAQLYFTQTEYDSILDGIYDDLHSGNYLDGFLSFVSRTDSYIKSGPPSAMKNYYVDEKGYLKQYYRIPWLISIGISSILTLIIMIILVNKNKMVTKARQAEDYVNKDSIHITNRKDVFVGSHTSSYTSSSSSGGGGGGFSSHSGSSGGGHSSGGGRHG